MNCYIHKHVTYGLRKPTYIDVGTLRTNIIVSISELRVMLLDNKKIYEGIGDTPKELYIESSKSKWPDGQAILDQTRAFNLDIVDSATKFIPILDSMIAQNETFLDNIESNKLRFGDWYAKLELNTPTPKRERVFAMIYKAENVDGITCEKCGAHVFRHDADNHAVNPACTIEQNRQAIIEKGWTCLKSLDEITAVRLAGIETDIVPQYYNIYAPKWIEAALKIYRQDTQYADLSLTEFLTKMRP